MRRKRRANATAEPRSVEQKVRLTPAELEVLRVRAGEAGVTVPRLLVESALAPDGVTVGDRRQWGMVLMAMQRQIGGAADNMNQVARKANTVHEVPSNFGTTIEELRKAAFRIGDLIDDLIAANTGPGERSRSPE